MVRLRSAFVGMLILLAPALVSAQNGGRQAPSPDSVGGLLRPGDVVRLRIWREPDLSGDFQVDESGIATFPKIGQVNVIQESPESLKRRLLESYGVYLRNPSVEVTMLRRINVLGAVQKPGLYPVDPTMTIADALAAAGGATSLGDQDKVELVRDGVTISRRINNMTRIAQTPLRSGDQIFVPERSLVARNLAAAGISVSASLVLALVLRKH